jgi:hypothetical protein
MEHEHSTVGEVLGSPAKQRPKKLGGSAAYNTKFYSKWCSKYPVKASSFVVSPNMRNSFGSFLHFVLL